MNQIRHHLQCLSMLTTATVSLAVENPKSFIHNVGERFRIRAAFSWLMRTLKFSSKDPLQSSKVNQGIPGDISGEISRLKSQGVWKRFVNSRRTSTLESLRGALNSNCYCEAQTSQPQRVNRPARVLYFATNSLPHTRSGYTYRTEKLINAVQQTGTKAVVATRFGYPLIVGRYPKSTVEEFNGIKYIRLLAWSYPRSLEQREKLAIREIRKICEQQTISVLHTTTDYKNARIIGQVAQKTGIPWVYEARGELENTWLSRFSEDEQSAMRESEFYLSARRAEEQAMMAADAVVTLSEVSRQRIIDRGIDPRKITVIPNAIDEAFLGYDYSKQEIRTELGLPTEAKIIGSITSVVGYEGLDSAVRVLQRLPENTLLLIVGDGVALPGLKDLASKLGMSGRVIFAGQKPNQTIWKWYAALDVFVLPRVDTEVCRGVTPLKPVLAQAMGIPVVASDLPALREICAGNGEFFSPGNVCEFEKAVSKAISGQTETLSGIEWARFYTWASNAQRLRKLYESLLQR